MNYSVVMEHEFELHFRRLDYNNLVSTYKLLRKYCAVYLLMCDLENHEI